MKGHCQEFCLFYPFCLLLFRLQDSFPTHTHSRHDVTRTLRNNGTQTGFTGGEGQYTQWVHCELIVGSETIRLAHTQRVHGGHCQEFPIPNMLNTHTYPASPSNDTPHGHHKPYPGKPPPSSSSHHHISFPNHYHYDYRIPPVFTTNQPHRHYNTNVPNHQYQ